MKKLALLLMIMSFVACGSKEPYRIHMTGPSIAAPMVPVFSRFPLTTNVSAGPIAFDIPQTLTLSTGTVIPAESLLEGYYQAKGNRVYFAASFLSYKDANGEVQRVQLSSAQTARIDLRTDSSAYGEKAGKGAAVGAVIGAIAGAMHGGWKGAAVGTAVGGGAGAAAGLAGTWLDTNNPKQLPAHTGFMLDFQNTK